MNINNRDFYYVRLRQQTLSLGSVDLRQQNNLFKNYCKPPLSNLGFPLPLGFPCTLYHSSGKSPPQKHI